MLHPERILSQRPLSITLQANKDQEISTKVKENERKLIQIKTKKDDTSPKHLYLEYVITLKFLIFHLIIHLFM